jgi:hypothetical protein
MDIDAKLAICEDCEHYCYPFSDEEHTCNSKGEPIKQIKQCDKWDEANREVKTTCDNCEKNLYEGDTYWGNNQIGTYCEECAEEEIAAWWGTIM